jgi:hypothetical protein
MAAPAEEGSERRAGNPPRAAMRTQSSAGDAGPSAALGPDSSPEWPWPAQSGASGWVAGTDSAEAASTVKLGRVFALRPVTAVSASWAPLCDQPTTAGRPRQQAGGIRAEFPRRVVQHPCNKHRQNRRIRGYQRYPTVTRQPGPETTKPQVRHCLTCGSARGQGRGRTADLPLFRRTLVPTELPARADETLQQRLGRAGIGRAGAIGARAGPRWQV